MAALTVASLKYIGRYLGRPVIATSRIDKYDGDSVTFHYNRHEDNKYVQETIPVMEFIQRLIRHIPEKHYKMIRYGGLYARHRETDKKLYRAISREKHPIYRSLNQWRTAILFAFGYDPLKCECGAKSERENKKFLDFLKKLEESPENFRITALQSKSLRKFMKKEYVNKKTGEAIHSSDIKAFVDFDKVAEYRKSMGYYQIITSELTMEPLEVIDKYHGLTQIEDQFHAMKSDLETRPIYVRTPEHVTAHLLTCMIALVVLRIIQKRITDSGTVKVSEDAYWSYGLSVERIQTALNKWKVDKLPGDLYRFMDTDDPDLLLILQAFSIEIPPKLY